MGDRVGGISVPLKPSWRDALTFDALSTRLSGKPRQLLVLSRHFFNRLLQNEVIPFEEQMKEKLIAIYPRLMIVYEDKPEELMISLGYPSQ
jgi:hypothetical protein